MRTSSDVTSRRSRPTSDRRTREYRQYLGIVAALRAAGWDTERQPADSPFAVEDPGFTAIAARAASDAAAAAVVAGIDGRHAAAVADALRAGLHALWDDELGWYRPFDTLAKGPVGPATSTGLVALWAGIAPARIERMMDRIDQWRVALPSAIPTSQPDDPSFDPIRYWRGPVWVLINWLVADGLAGAGFADRADVLRTDTQTAGRTGLLGVLRPAQRRRHRRPGVLMECRTHTGLAHRCLNRPPDPDPAARSVRPWPIRAHMPR